MMPKGVEHITGPSDLPVALGVKKSMMPKGVEHIISQGGDIGSPGEEIYDAERR